MACWKICTDILDRNGIMMRCILHKISVMMGKASVKLFHIYIVQYNKILYTEHASMGLELRNNTINPPHGWIYLNLQHLDYLCEFFRKWKYQLLILQRQEWAMWAIKRNLYIYGIIECWIIRRHSWTMEHIFLEFFLRKMLTNWLIYIIKARV